MDKLLAMETPDPNQIRAFLDMSLGRLSNRSLVSRAQDRLADPDPPAWASELASLSLSEVLDAQGVLERQLHQAGVLPDSEALRSEIRKAIAEWVDRVEAAGIVETDGVTPTVVPLLRLCPNYLLSDLSIPVEEFPYPPSGIETAEALAHHIREHLQELVPGYDA